MPDKPSPQPSPSLPPSRPVAPPHINWAPYRPLIVLALILAAVAIWAYWPSLAAIGAAWVSNPDYTHGFFVVPISIWLLWVRRGQAPNIAFAPDWRALILLVLAALIRVAAGRFFLPELDAWSIPVWIAGIVWLLLGWPVLRWALLPIAFLWFATPLPGTIEIALSTPLQRIAAVCSSFILRLFGQPALAEGTTILLDDQVLDVERACSGLRMCYGIFALAVACIALARPARWKAILVLLAAAPVAIAANVLRISATGLIQRYVSSAAAEKFTHDFAGFVMIPVAVLLFLLFLKILGRLVSRFQDAGAVAWLTRWALALIVVCTALYFWGQRQETRAVNTLRDTAARYEAEKNWAESIHFLDRYLRAVPDDNDSYTHMAQIYYDHAFSYQDRLRGLELMQNAWKREPERDELALNSIRLCMQLQQPDQAISICDQLLAKSKNPQTIAAATNMRADALLAYVQSDKNRGDYSWEHVRQALDNAVKLPNYDVKYAELLANVYRLRLRSLDKQKREKMADDLMDRAVAERKDDPLAWLARFNYRLRFGGAAAASAADQDLAHAVELADTDKQNTNPIVYIVAAQRAAGIRDADRTIQLLKKAIDRAPADYRAYFMLADVKRASGRPEDRLEAIQILRDGIAKTGNRQALALPLATLLAEQGNIKEAEQEVEPYEKMLPQLNGQERAFFKLGTALVRARITNAKEGPQQALTFIRDTLAESDVLLVEQSAPQTLAQAYGLLGQLAASLGMPDVALTGFQNASRLEPANLQWKLQAAAMAQQSGDLDTAASDYQTIIERGAAAGPTYAALSQLEINRQMQRRPAERDWTRAKQLIQAARDAKAPEITVRLFAADVQAAMGDKEKSAQIITKTTEDLPNEPAGWRALAVLRLRNKDEAGALQAAENFTKLTGGSGESVALRTSILAATNHLDQAVKEMSDFIAKAPPDQVPNAALVLSQFLGQARKPAESIAVLEKAHEKAPKNIPVIDTLATMAWLSQDWKALEKYESWLHTIEGDQGTLWRSYRAQRLMNTAKSSNDKEFTEAADIVADLVRERPQWSKSHLLNGEIALRMNRMEAAAESFQQAWKLGGRGIVLSERLIDVLTRLGRVKEARQFIGQSSDYFAVSPDLFDRAVQFLDQSSDSADMLRLAQQWVDDKPNNADAHLRLARVFFMAGQSSPDKKDEFTNKAEAEFRRAIELAPTNVAAWVAGVTFYAQTEKDPAKALQLLDQFAKQTKIDELQRNFVLAQMYEAMGFTSRAQPFYQKVAAAAEANPKAPGAGEALGKTALFYVSRVPELANLYSRRAIAINPADPTARYVLLNLLSNQQGKESVEEAMRLLDDPATKNALDPSLEARLRATLLVRRGGPGDVDAAIDVLQKSLSQSREDKLMLARVYEKAGRIAPAIEVYEQLIRAPDAQAPEIVEFIRFWQDHFLASAKSEAAAQFAGEARQAYERLGNLPGQLPERARWQLRALRVRNPSAPLADDAVLAVVSQVTDSDAAKRLGEAEAKQNFQGMLLVLLQEGCDGPAIKLASAPPKGTTAEEAAVFLSHSFVAVPSGQQISPSRKQALENMLTTFSDKPQIIQAVGDCAFMNADYQLAIQAYERVLAIDPKYPMTRNNMALALAEIPGKMAEARQNMTAALADDPQSLDLLDTQASIEIIDQKPAAAIAILEKIVAAAPENSVPRLHLASAYDQANKPDLASNNLLASAALGIQRQILSPRDREQLVKLHGRYIVAKAAAAADSKKSTSTDGETAK